MEFFFPIETSAGEHPHANTSGADLLPSSATPAQGSVVATEMCR